MPINDISPPKQKPIKPCRAKAPVVAVRDSWTGLEVEGLAGESGATVAVAMADMQADRTQTSQTLVGYLSV